MERISNKQDTAPLAASPPPVEGEKAKFNIREKTTRQLISNLMSAILFFLVTLFCNLFLDGKFDYAQIFRWNIGLLVLINWVCGITISFCLRQSGINSAKMTRNVTTAENKKAEKFNSIKNYSVAQKKLNFLSAIDFENRRAALENTIANMVKHLMSPEEQRWTLGQKLPKKTPLKVRKYLAHLERMSPSTPSLTALSQAEGSFSTRGAYEVPAPVDKTGIKWFVTKAGSKIGWFALAPIVLSIIASMLISGDVTLGSVTTVIGTIGIMTFNGGKAYAAAFYDVTVKGVARDEQIARIIDTINTTDIDDATIDAYYAKKMPQPKVDEELQNVESVAGNNADRKDVAPQITAESIKTEQP